MLLLFPNPNPLVTFWLNCSLSPVHSEFVYDTISQSPQQLGASAVFLNSWNALSCASTVTNACKTKLKLYTNK